MTREVRHPFHADGCTCVDAIAQAATLRAQDIDACVLWLRHNYTGEGWRLAHRIMLSSVFAQAAIMGVTSCAGCGDVGCWRCRRGR